MWSFLRRPHAEDEPLTTLKVVMGLGNPGAEYLDTRHNAGWWLLDALAEAWGFGRFKREKEAAIAGGRVEGYAVRLVKPLTYMNRSGRALATYARMNVFEPSRDLLVVVDDVALPPGRARFRPEGSAGGHNGLRSVEATLRSREYPRLRLGVGGAPPQADLADWVLSAPSRADRGEIMERFPELVEGVALWLREGIRPAMNRYNG